MFCSEERDDGGVVCDGISVRNRRIFGTSLETLEFKFWFVMLHKSVAVTCEQLHLTLYDYKYVLV